MFGLTDNSPSIRDALTERRLYLLGLVKLIKGNHQGLTVVERKSIDVMNAAVKHIDNRLSSLQKT